MHPTELYGTHISRNIGRFTLTQVFIEASESEGVHCDVSVGHFGF